MKKQFDLETPVAPVTRNLDDSSVGRLPNSLTLLQGSFSPSEVIDYHKDRFIVSPEQYQQTEAVFDGTKLTQGFYVRSGIRQGCSQWPPMKPASIDHIWSDRASSNYCLSPALFEADVQCIQSVQKGHIALTASAKSPRSPVRARVVTDLRHYRLLNFGKSMEVASRSYQSFFPTLHSRSAAIANVVPSALAAPSSPPPQNASVARQDLHDAMRLRNDGYYHSTLPPLPDEVYPRVIPERRRDAGYWIVWAVVAGVQAVTPLSAIYLTWYMWQLPRSPLLACAAVYALIEVVFAIYHLYLSRKIQPPAPGSVLPPDALSDMFLRCLHAGLAVTAPLARTRAYSAPGSWPEVRNGIDAVLAQTKSNGESAGKKVGLGVPSSTNSTTRRRLTRLDSTSLQPYDPDEDVDPLFDTDGRPRVLASDDPRAVEFREQLRTWFYHAPWESIHEEDVLHWLAWSAFALPVDAVLADAKKKRFLDRTYTMLEARTGTTFPPGKSGTKVMKLSLDPVLTRQRPFIIYALANSINFYLRRVEYPYRGAMVYREGDIDYLVRIPPGWTPEKGRTEPNAMPVVYMHGLGFGLLQNHFLLKHLVASLPTHPLLVPLAHHTAQEVFHWRYLKPWTRPELVSTLKAACKRFGFYDPDIGGGVSMLSHSNGSVHHGWAVKDCPELIKRSTFVDPVVFCLWEGDVCFNFCYRVPTTGLELLLDYFVATEIGIAHYIHRHFVWSDNTLFVEDIPNATDPTKTAFFIGGEDIIINAPRTRLYLERNGIRNGLHWDARGGHGDGLLGEARDRVVMYVGTGSTKGWEGWLTRGRRSHSVGQRDRPNLNK